MTNTGQEQAKLTLADLLKIAPTDEPPIVEKSHGLYEYDLCHVCHHFVNAHAPNCWWVLARALLASQTALRKIWNGEAGIASITVRKVARAALLEKGGDA